MCKCFYSQILFLLLDCSFSLSLSWFLYEYLPLHMLYSRFPYSCMLFSRSLCIYNCEIQFSVCILLRQKVMSCLTYVATLLHFTKTKCEIVDLVVLQPTTFCLTLYEFNVVHHPLRAKTLVSITSCLLCMSVGMACFWWLHE